MGRRERQNGMVRNARVASCAVTAVAAFAVLLAGCVGGAPAANTTSPSVSSTAESAATGTRLLRLGDGYAVRVPRRWVVAPFRGVPATVYFPMFFLASRPMPPECRPGPRTTASCQAPTWFPPRWHTPRDGLLIMWGEAEIPMLRRIPSVFGRRTTIGGLPARSSAGPATDMCPPDTARERDAAVLVSTRRDPAGRFDMRACLGAVVDPADRAAVGAMLASLHHR
jgi:hypothetical protein